MATTQVQRRRGTTADYNIGSENGFKGAEGEFTYDETLKTIRVHDGETVGGFPLVKAPTTPITPSQGDDPILVKIKYDFQGLILETGSVVWDDLSSILSGHIVSPNAAITPGTGCKITYDAKGLVTGSSSLSVSDLPSIPFAKIVENTTDPIPRTLPTVLNTKMDLIPNSVISDAEGTISLVPGGVYNIKNLQDAIILAPQTPTNTALLNQIMVQIQTVATDSVGFSGVSYNFGVGTGGISEALAEGGVFNLYFEYDNNVSSWVVGIIKKTLRS